VETGKHFLNKLISQGGTKLFLLMVISKKNGSGKKGKNRRKMSWKKKTKREVLETTLLRLGRATEWGNAYGLSLCGSRPFSAACSLGTG